MTYSAAQFEQDIAFERHVLDEIAPAIMPSYGVQVIDYVDGELQMDANAVVPAVRAGVSFGGKPVNVDISPMIFGIAWKVIDVLLDSILGKHANGDPLSIKAKRNAAKNGKGPKAPEPFAKDPDIWMRFMRLYANTMDLRHSIMHRGFGVLRNGNLEATPDRGQVTPPTVMTPEELKYFFRAVQGFYEALIKEELSARKRSNLCALLDGVESHHKLGLLGGGEVTRDVLVLARAQELPSGKFEFDARPVMKEVRNRFPSGAVNLLLFMPDGVALTGELEDAPTDRPAPIRADHPEKWLRVVPEAEWQRWTRRRP